MKPIDCNKAQVASTKSSERIVQYVQVTGRQSIFQAHLWPARRLLVGLTPIQVISYAKGSPWPQLAAWGSEHPILLTFFWDDTTMATTASTVSNPEPTARNGGHLCSVHRVVGSCRSPIDFVLPVAFTSARRRRCPPQRHPPRLPWHCRPLLLPSAVRFPPIRSQWAVSHPA